MQPIKFTVTALIPADVGVTNRRPSSDSELISPMEMRMGLLVRPENSREPYQTVSMVYFILGNLRTDLWSQGIKRRALSLGVKWCITRTRGKLLFLARNTIFTYSLPIRFCHISIVFSTPPLPPSHLYCLPSSPEPPHFYCFPFTDATITFLMESLSIDDGDGDGDVNENGKQATGLDWQNDNSARDHVFCTFLCRHCTTTTTT